MEKRLKIQSMGEKELPVDIINEVLLRMPVKSLIRFKCVSKFWLSLITHPQFPRSHLKYNQDGNFTNKLQSSVILSKGLCGMKLPIDELVLQSIGGGYKEDAFREAMMLVCPLHKKVQSVVVVGHCDGILCLVIDFFYILLWNPCIRESKILPLPRCVRYARDRGYPNAGMDDVYGFGYDSLTDDYKIVRIPQKWGKRCNFPVNVFTLKTNSWRRIQDVPHYIKPFQDPIAAYGGLYWRVSTRRNMRGLILHFDFAEETFREVALPPCNKFGDNMITLAIWGGSPCVLGDYTLWVLGEGGAWTKLMTLPEMPPPEPPEYSFFLEPLCVTNTGKVFIAVDGRKFVLYDPKERTYEKLDICGLVGKWIHMTVFTESLISPGTGIVAELQR